MTSTIEHYDVAINSGNPTSDANRTTTYSYDGLDHTIVLTAVLPSSTYQATQYSYGVAPSGGVGINSNSLLAMVQYPDKSSGNPSTNTSDQNSFTYDALGEVITRKDQNGSVHTYSYDVLGRTTADTITTVAAGVDSGVRSIGIGFDASGRPYQLTSYDSANSVVNQLQRSYNSLDQLTGEYQSHSGAVATGTTPQIQYGYTAGSNYNRLSGVTYPNGRVVDYLYSETGGSGGVSNAISRVTAIATSTTRGTTPPDANVIASYDYVGLSTIVRKNYPTPGVRLDRFGGTSGTYAGLDQFNRIIDQEWTAYNVSTSPYANTTGGDLFKINHGYDRDSNRLYADNQTQSGSGHSYVYDNLNRLTTDKGGALNSTETDVHAWPKVNDAWTLDPLGNPTVTANLDSGGTLNTVNAQNQITDHKVQAAQAINPLVDPFTSNTASDWELADPNDAFSISGGILSINTVVQSAAEQAHGLGPIAMVFVKRAVGPFSELHGWGGGNGKSGLVFGFKSFGDFWTYSRDTATQTGGIYHVVNGTWTLIQTMGYGYDFSLYVRSPYLWDAYGNYGSPFSNGFPSGRIGFFTTTSPANFGPLSISDRSVSMNIGSRWIQNCSSANIWENLLQPDYHPILLKGFTLQKFEATFHVSCNSGESGLNFVFDATDGDHFSDVTVDVSGAFAYPRTGGAGTEVHNDPALDLSAVDAGGYWVRVTEDGSTLAVREAVSLTSLDSATPSYTASAFSCTGGTFGFYYLDGINGIDRFILKSYNASTNNFPTTELDENFVIDSSSYTSDKLAYDANGNLTYDGVQSYTYDAWNRLKTAAHAYRIAVADGGDGNVHSGQVGGMYSYDAAGRRIVKAVNGTGVMDCTYNEYYSGQSVVEERNGSNIPIKDHVWGLGYVDEAVQTRVNTNPTGTASWTSYWLCQDANYNVLGIVNASGTLVERYEYSAYGSRQVFTSAGSNDPGCYAPTMMSTRVVASGSVVEPYGINDVGHQGLVHDEETGLVYNRARIINPPLGRFMQNDPLGYVDGADSYLGYRDNPIKFLDSKGTTTGQCEDTGIKHWIGNWIPVGRPVPGTQEGGSGDVSMSMFAPRQYFIRHYKTLFKCCDACDKPYTKWGRDAAAIAYDESSAQIDAQLGSDIRISLPLPIGFGKSIKPISFGLYKGWAPGVNPTLVSSGPTSAVDYALQQGQLDPDKTFVGHIKCDPSGSYWKVPPAYSY